MKKPVNMGIIGLGRWGINYFRTFNEITDCAVKHICATKEKTLKEALEKIKPKKIPKLSINYEQLLADKELDAIAITTPGSTHYKLAKEALKANKHVIVEKPVAFSSKDVKELIRLSREKNKILMAGHQHLFNPGIQKLKSDMSRGLFGKINFIHLAHFGNGPIRTDMSALWDFFPHSVSIFLYLLEKFPIAISANGESYINKGIEDIVTMDAIFPDKIFAVSIGSWLYPIKKMEIVIAGEKLYATFDDYAQHDKLKYYRNRPRVASGKIVMEDNGYETPKLSDAKPLTEQLKHFLYCIQNNKIPLTGGQEALKVTKVLESAQKSLRNQGKPIKITK